MPIASRRDWSRRTRGRPSLRAPIMVPIRPAGRNRSFGKSCGGYPANLNCSFHKWFSLLFRKKNDKFISVRGSSMYNEVIDINMARALELERPRIRDTSRDTTSLPTRSPKAWHGHRIQGASSPPWNAMSPSRSCGPEYAANPELRPVFPGRGPRGRGLAPSRTSSRFSTSARKATSSFFSMSYIEGETFENWIEGQALVHRGAREVVPEPRRGGASFRAQGEHRPPRHQAGQFSDRSGQQHHVDRFRARPENRQGRGGGQRARGFRHAGLCLAGTDFPRGDRPAHRHLFARRHAVPFDDGSSSPSTAPTIEDIIWGHLEKPFPIEICHEANLSTGWIHLIKKMMERDPRDDRFADYRELRDALENVHSFRYETDPDRDAVRTPKPTLYPAHRQQYPDAARIARGRQNNSGA